MQSFPGDPGDVTFASGLPDRSKMILTIEDAVFSFKHILAITDAQVEDADYDYQVRSKMMPMIGNASFSSTMLIPRRGSNSWEFAPGPP